jgi:hypothetical protein
MLYISLTTVPVMKWLGAFASCLAFNSVALAANCFAGSNLYYAAGLSSAQRATLFRYSV